MTKPKRLRLVPLDIPVEDGMIDGTGSTDRDEFNHADQLGVDFHGAASLIFAGSDHRPRRSIHDPRWSPNHGFRYIEWVTPC